MAEAIISRRGSNTSSSIGNLQTELITSNKTWVVPAHKGNISVRIFGGGSSGLAKTAGEYAWEMYGGGSGWMNNKEFNNLTNGQIIQITIGRGGTPTAVESSGKYNYNYSSGAGGTTSFGTYLSANGGSGKDGGAGGGGSLSSNYYLYISGTVRGGIGYQFGGGGMYTAMQYYSDRKGPDICRGGNGGMWGGGGGAYSDPNSLGTKQGYVYGGNGGTYGGGGFGGAGWAFGAYSPSANNGKGGTYGGNGGTTEIDTILNQKSNLPAENGTNTMSFSNVNDNCKGFGIVSNYSDSDIICLSGGGGYGGNGGPHGGGGGGYGGNGGSGGSSYTISGIGGGGGYGRGADGGNGGTESGGGGGGYVSKGGDSLYLSVGGGGGFGCGADRNNAAGFGGGGAIGYYNITNDKFKGGDGICIIQYYT